MSSEIRRTTCNRDCPDVCGILATVQDGRVVALEGDPDHPITRGFLCPRTARVYERQYAADRVLTPLVRESLDVDFRPATWDEALDLIAGRLDGIRRESGGAAILHYRCGGRCSVGMAAIALERMIFSYGCSVMMTGALTEVTQELRFPLQWQVTIW